MVTVEQFTSEHGKAIRTRIDIPKCKHKKPCWDCEITPCRYVGKLVTRPKKKTHTLALHNFRHWGLDGQDSRDRRGYGGALLNHNPHGNVKFQCFFDPILESVYGLCYPIKDIKAGTELTWNYGQEVWKNIIGVSTYGPNVFARKLAVRLNKNCNIE